MSVLEKLVRVIAPHYCLGCEVEEDRLLCSSCVLSLPLVPSRCYRCKAVTENYQTCQRCSAYTPLKRLEAYTFYKDLAKELVHHTKYERAQSGAVEMAHMLATRIDIPDGAILTHVPTATSRVRARGYDHARLLTKALPKAGLPSHVLLARLGQTHQVGARRSERVRQLEGAFRPVHIDQIRGKHIVLVDDVLTTGATLEKAARVLRQAGAARVDAVVFAQA